MDRFICPPDHKHGENGTCYQQHKCRCEGCKRGRAEYQFWYVRNRNKAALVDATGTRRRLRALVAMGWSLNAIADREGCSWSRIRNWRDAELVQVSTVQSVRRVYDDMSMRVPQPRTKSERAAVTYAKRYAARNGWVPPLAWDDETIDDPDAVPDVEGVAQVVVSEVFADRFDPAVVDAAVRGQKPDLSPLERRQVITVLNGQRWSARRIAEHIGCATRTVDRIRGELELPIYLAGRNNLNRERNAA